MASTFFNEPSVSRTLGLRVEDATFWISREALAGFSPVFEAMFYNKEFTDHKQEIIPLPGKNAANILEMLCVIFPSPKTKEIYGENVDAMLALADEFQMEDLKMKCQKYLLGKLQNCPDNSSMVLHTLKTAHKYNMWEAFRECAKKCKAFDFKDLIPVITEMRPGAMACVLLYVKSDSSHVITGNVVRYGSWNRCTRHTRKTRPLMVSCYWCGEEICPTCKETAVCKKDKLDKMVDKILASL